LREGTQGVRRFDRVAVRTLETTMSERFETRDALERAGLVDSARGDADRADASALERINALVRGVNRVLVRAETRQDIARGVCEQVTTGDRLAFAWVGHLDPAGGELAPIDWAGEDQGYLQEVTSGTALDAECEPAVRAARGGQLTVVDDVVGELEAGGWARRALKSGFQAAAAVPLRYDGSQYGVLSIYGDRSGVFDGELPSVFRELGDTIAYSITATQRKRALLTDEVTELEFEIRDPRCPVLALAREAGCSITLRNVLARPSEGVVALVAVPRTGIDAMLTAVGDSDIVEDARPVAETEGDWLVQLRSSRSLVAEDLAEYGAHLRGLGADEGAVQICVQVPSTRAQTTIEMIERTYSGAKLLARRHQCERDHHRSDATRFWEQLTDRQREVAQLAFHAGYFDRPREHTGEELADRLDVSAQAYHKHLRHIQRTLFETVLENDAETPG
jgi:predicted DNA binding protein/GAF domain-containing protein